MKYFWQERNEIVEDGISTSADGIDVSGMPLYEDTAEYIETAEIQAELARQLVGNFTGSE